MRHQPLVLTQSDRLLQRVITAADAAGLAFDVADEPAPEQWVRAPLVVVGADQLTRCVEARLPARDGVLVVTDDAESESLWCQAFQLGAQVTRLPGGEDLLEKHLAYGTDRPVGGTVLAVMGGRGGAGATAFAACLAQVACRRGAHTLLVDGDPLGGGIDLLVGAEELDGERWPAFLHTRGPLPPDALRGSLPRVGPLTVLSRHHSDPTAIPVAAMQSILDGGRREYDLVVVDLPRWPDPAATLALRLASAAVVVVPADIRAVSAARGVVDQASRHTAELSVLVREGNLPPQAIAETLGLPCAGMLPYERRLADDIDSGRGVSGRHFATLLRCAGTYLDRLERRREAA
jgi:secretion/DNA translocation related CpaE-like protein